MSRVDLARERIKRDLRKEMPAHGLLGDYLNWMNQENPEGAESLRVDLRKIFETEEGLRVLKLFEKAVLYAPVSNGAPESALRENNAVRNFVHEIRRHLAHG